MTAGGQRRAAIEDADVVEAEEAALVALLDSAIHDAQSFRNHSVGRRCSSAASGPRLAAVIFTRMSSGPALAHSTKMSKYRSSLKTRVSSNSYSNSFRERRRFVSTRSA